MIKQIDILVDPDDIHHADKISILIQNTLRIKNFEYEILRRSIDARKRPPQFNLKIAVYIDEAKPILKPSTVYQNTRNSDQRVMIIGAGPAGYFAALKLIEHGIKPIILERGKDVQSRRKDLRQIQQFGHVNEHSNYCFGEGGAGTYSDGKLYTRSKKRGNIQHILDVLVQHGANKDILIDAHPHIGSNKLPVIIQNIRETIVAHGGEVHFDSWVDDILIEKNRAIGASIANEPSRLADAIVLATGHSARDIFAMLAVKKIAIEAKPFALGVRIEHPQTTIDHMQYGDDTRHASLPAANYALSCQIDNRGVYSFCMCPGGFIVPASTSPGQLVINGMSLSRRDSRYANSGIVVSVELDDIPEYIDAHGPLACMAFQRHIEELTFAAGGDETQRAPAQRLIDFLDGVISKDLPSTSYIPGLMSAPLHEILPPFITSRMKKAFVEFNKKLNRYIQNDAVLVAIESRTSSPVKIPRHPTTLEHVEINRLYPCGEGAGYAGGIISAAIDGQRVADAIANRFATD